jgi:hypothetical protein
MKQDHDVTADHPVFLVHMRHRMCLGQQVAKLARRDPVRLETAILEPCQRCGIPYRCVTDHPCRPVPAPEGVSARCRHGDAARRRCSPAVVQLRATGLDFRVAWARPRPVGCMVSSSGLLTVGKAGPGCRSAARVSERGIVETQSSYTEIRCRQFPCCGLRMPAAARLGSSVDIRSHCLCRRCSETGNRVPSCCANSDTRISSIIHR